MARTSIEWTDYTWSPLRVRVKPNAGAIAREKGYTSLIQIADKMAGRVGPHCEHVSEGCANCYSGTNNHRCLPSNGTGLPFDRRSRDLVDGFVDEKILAQPLRWKTPRKVFVENQSDLFGEWVTDEAIDRVFAVMALSPHIIYQVLTKRADRMRDYARGPVVRIVDQICKILGEQPRCRYPFPNVHLGVSVEDQPTADARIVKLLQTPAAVWFVSYEPALARVDFKADWLHKHYRAIPGYRTGIDWVIVGGESGPDARPFDIEWARSTIRQCKAAGVPVFVKQLGSAPYYIPSPTSTWAVVISGDVGTGAEDSGSAQGGRRSTVDRISHRGDLLTRGDGFWRFLNDRKGGDWDEWPADLRVREFPDYQPCLATSVYSGAAVGERGNRL